MPEDLEGVGRPDYEAKKARVEHLSAIADGEVAPDADEPQVIWCLDESGPLNLMPGPGRQWAERGGRHNDPKREPAEGCAPPSTATTAYVEIAYTPTNSSWLNRIPVHRAALQSWAVSCRVRLLGHHERVLVPRRHQRVPPPGVGRAAGRRVL